MNVFSAIFVSWAVFGLNARKVLLFTGVMLMCLFMLQACVSTGGRYLGDEYYYSEGGKLYSCRAPKPFLGGNCKLEADWAKPGLN